MSRARVVQADVVARISRRLPQGAAALLPLLVLYLAVPLAFGPSGPQDDEAVYLRIAERITDGRYADASVSDADFVWYPPALPGLLSPLVAAGLPLDLIRLAGPLCLFGAVLALWRTLLRTVSQRLALAGAYAFGLYPAFLILVRRTFSEPLALLCITVAMLLVTRAVQRRPPGDALGAGLALGVLALTRAVFGWILVLCLVAAAVWWLARRSSRSVARIGAVVALVALGCTVPWLAYTYEKSDRPLYWSNSGGLSLYWMASPYPGDYGDWHAYGEVPPRHMRFFARLGHLRGPVQRDVALQKRALHWIRDSPGGYLGNLAPNVSRILFGAPYRGEGLRASSIAYALPNLLLLPAFAWALAQLVRRRGRLPAEGLLFLGFGAMTLGFHLLLSADPRMLVPVLPVTVWLIAWAVGGERGSRSLCP